MYAWLNGPGAHLKEPLPGSTNYLGAYDKYGNLVRAPAGWQRQTPGETKEEPKREESNSTDQRGEGSVDELEMSVRKTEAQNKSEPEIELPPESEQDLRPFPLNPYFRSQPVLSEELREAIYNRVVNEGASVSLASVEFGVSNERVGAVVRLKQLEKQWIAEVRRMTEFSSSTSLYDETTPNRLVFKTFHMVTLGITSPDPNHSVSICHCLYRCINSMLT
jgi:hypothetical protein